MSERLDTALGLLAAVVFLWDLTALSPFAAVTLEEPSALAVAAVATYVARQLGLLLFVALTLGPAYADSRLPGPLPRHTGAREVSS